MSDPYSPGHTLLLEFAELPELVEGLGPDDELTAAGLNSGDLIRLALAVEDRISRPLDDEEITALHTVRGIDQVLAGQVRTDDAEREAA